MNSRPTSIERYHHEFLQSTTIVRDLERIIGAHQRRNYQGRPSKPVDVCRGFPKLFKDETLQRVLNVESGVLDERSQDYGIIL